jgi:tRNA pseudouridine55 synthase
MNGVIVVDKPAGFTSFDVVAVMRGICHERKIGHTGTLDPMATGVLPLLLGSATRALPFLEDTSKEYRAGFRFGTATDTQDITGHVTAQSSVKVTRGQLQDVLPQFRGDIMQTPPMYSAVSVNGRRLYDLARQGIEVERKKRPVTIFRMELVEFDEALQEGCLEVACSKGTYIRTICANLGEALGTCGVMTSLRRARASGFSLDDAITIGQAKELAAQGRIGECLKPTESLFAGMPKVSVSQAQAVRFSNGGALDVGRTPLRARLLQQNMRFRIFAPDGVFLGLGTVLGDELRVLRLFRLREERR